MSWWPRRPRRRPAGKRGAHGGRRFGLSSRSGSSLLGVACTRSPARRPYSASSRSRSSVDRRASRGPCERRSRRCKARASSRSMRTTRTARLADVAEVASATYNRDFPHTLVVSVRSERPVALLRRGGEAWLVSDGARVLSQVVQRPFPALPRVWISPTADPLDGAVLDGDAALAVRTIPPMTHGAARARAIWSGRSTGSWRSCWSRGRRSSLATPLACA